MNIEAFMAIVLVSILIFSGVGLYNDSNNKLEAYKACVQYNPDKSKCELPK